MMSSSKIVIVVYFIRPLLNTVILRYESHEVCRDTSMNDMDRYRFSLKEYGFSLRNCGMSGGQTCSIVALVTDGSLTSEHHPHVSTRKEGLLVNQPDVLGQFTEFILVYFFEGSEPVKRQLPAVFLIRLAIVYDRHNQQFSKHACISFNFKLSSVCSDISNWMTISPDDHSTNNHVTQ